MAIAPYFFCNKNGIPCIESQSANLTTTSCTYYFKNHPFLNSNYQGLVAVKIAQSVSAPSTSVPVMFDTVGAAAPIQVKTRGNTAVDTSDINALGVYLCFYDRSSNTLQLIA